MDISLTFLFQVTPVLGKLHGLNGAAFLHQGVQGHVSVIIDAASHLLQLFHSLRRSIPAVAFCSPWPWRDVPRTGEEEGERITWVLCRTHRKISSFFETFYMKSRFSPFKQRHSFTDQGWDRLTARSRGAVHREKEDGNNAHDGIPLGE